MDKQLTELDQAEFLRAAREQLGMSRVEFADRIAIKVKTLDDWMIPAGTKAARKMPPMAFKFISEILERENLVVDNTRKAGI